MSTPFASIRFTVCEQRFDELLGHTRRTPRTVEREGLRPGEKLLTRHRNLMQVGKLADDADILLLVGLLEGNGKACLLYTSDAADE